MKVCKLNEKLKASIEKLANETDEAKVNQQMIDFFNFSSRFHQYSASNLWMIYCHNPDVTMVMGYKAWNTVGRYVKKGETGIPIFAPHKYEQINSDGSEENKIGFHVVYIFDVSQTEGAELPEPPDWKSPEKHESLSNAITAYCISKGITVAVETLHGETQGISKGGEIVLSPDAGTKTLVHELAHELLHRDNEGKSLAGNLKELEAESVAYVVGTHFGLDDLQSSNYIALHKNDPKDILKHMDRIMKVCKSIIVFVEKEMENDTVNEPAKVYA